MKKIRNININEKEFIDLRNSFFENQKNESTDNLNLNFYENGNFSIHKFNNYFEEFKFQHEDDGYGNMMKDSTIEREDIEIKQINFKHFHDQFVKKNKNDKTIEKYRSPDACNYLDNYSDIVMENKNNYSTNLYSDYKDAFHGSGVNYEQKVEKRDLESIKKSRENPESLLCSKEEILILEKEKDNEDKLKYEQEQKVKTYNKRLELYNKKMEKLIRH